MGQGIKRRKERLKKYLERSESISRVSLFDEGGNFLFTVEDHLINDVRETIVKGIRKELDFLERCEEKSPAESVS